MIELIYMLMMSVCGFLYAFGGWQNLIWRRYALPLVLVGFLFWLNKYRKKPITLWQILIACALLCGFTHLPYGETIPYWSKFLVGVSFAIPSLLIGKSIWVFIVPIVFIVTFALSNFQPTALAFVWKVCEFLVGTSITISFIAALQNSWGKE